MQLDETACAQAMLREQRIDMIAGLGAGVHLQLAGLRRRLQPQAAQRIQMCVDGMATPATDGAIQMRKGILPPLSALGALWCDGPAGAEQAGQPGSARMVGQVNDKIVLACTQGLQETPFVAQLGKRPQFFPVPSDAVQLGQCRVPSEHGCRVGKDQGIDLALRRSVFEAGKDRPAEQDVAMVAQFDDQRPAQLRRLDGIGQIGGGCWMSHGRIVTAKLVGMRESETAAVETATLPAERAKIVSKAGPDFLNGEDDDPN
jgi:hypothetical protein